MRLFDTHTHLNFSQFDADREDLLRKYQSEGLYLTNVGCDYKSSKLGVEIASRFEKGVYATIGQHPTDTAESFDEEKYSELITDKVVAVGECGLDYYHEKEEAGRKKQKIEFVKQIVFAQKQGLPLVIHCRDLPTPELRQAGAYEDLLQILKSEYKSGAIIHSFTDSWEIAKKFLDLGYYIALNAILIFDKTGKLPEVVKNLPADRILTETDAPFLSPNRGKRNEPGNVMKVVEKLAELRGESVEQVSEYTFANACNFFSLPQR